MGIPTRRPESPLSLSFRLGRPRGGPPLHESEAGRFLHRCIRQIAHTSRQMLGGLGDQPRVVFYRPGCLLVPAMCSDNTSPWPRSSSSARLNSMGTASTSHRFRRRCIPTTTEGYRGSQRQERWDRRRNATLTWPPEDSHVEDKEGNCGKSGLLTEDSGNAENDDGSRVFVCNNLRSRTNARDTILKSSKSAATSYPWRLERGRNVRLPGRPFPRHWRPRRHSGEPNTRVCQPPSAFGFTER